MKNQSIIISILLLIVCINSYAQNNIDSIKTITESQNNQIPIDTVKAIYEREAIYIDGNRAFIKDKYKIRFGFWNKKIKKQLSVSKDAIKEFHEYRKLETNGFVLYIGGLIGMMAVVSTTSSPLGLLFMIPVIYSLNLIIEAPEHFHKAIWVYNRDILMQKLKENKTK